MRCSTRLSNCRDRRRAIGADEIVRRALATIVNESAKIVREGVASRASDIDVVLVHGYGFPRWVGGPVHWASRRGADVLDRDLDEVAAKSGAGFVRADPAVLR